MPDIEGRGMAKQGHERAEQLQGLKPVVEGRPGAMVALARQFAAIGDKRIAVELAERARALPGCDGETCALIAELLSDDVPSWHLGLLRDEVRNASYEAAIRRAVRPGATVLEIGTGSGILAMMAARAGAHVVTCEANPSVAAAARAVIAANGLTREIRVLEKHSTQLDASDLAGPADILISEIVSNDLLSEGVLPAHVDALTRLVKPDAPVIPVRGRVRIALAQDRHWQDTRVGRVSGFDLSAFNRVWRPYREIRADSARVLLRSDAADAFDFDFAARRSGPDRRTTITLLSNGGPVNGIAQWIALDLDDASTYENAPEAGSASCWAVLFWPFSESIETRAGDSLQIGAFHSADRIRLWREAGF
jgi:type II protein arginine methyltransferase